MLRKLAFTGALLASTAASASTDPTSFITNVENQLQVAARQPSSQSSFRKLFEKDFDIPGISRFVLGRFARTLRQTDQQRFARYFEDYVVMRRAGNLSNGGPGMRRSRRA